MEQQIFITLVASHKQKKRQSDEQKRAAIKRMMQQYMRVVKAQAGSMTKTLGFRLREEMLGAITQEHMIYHT